ncbi:unnamed protein product [Sphagnum jensenii]|uniref:Uncharacterized protein n=1 Tax=Sphagnum jensenii TaxID=128206 RepID=A0ABP1B580_9BRYO
MHTRVYDAEVLAVPEIFWSAVHLRDCLDFRVREERVLPSAERGKCFKTPRFQDGRFWFLSRRSRGSIVGRSRNTFESKLPKAFGSWVATRTILANCDRL